jgi:hypothetical protein
VARRAQAVLEAVERRSGRACIPAPVLAEVARTPARRAAVGRVGRRIPVIPTDRVIAELAGMLLERCRLDSRHAIDAFVAPASVYQASIARVEILAVNAPLFLSRSRIRRATS